MADPLAAFAAVPPRTVSVGWGHGGNPRPWSAPAGRAASLRRQRPVAVPPQSGQRRPQSATSASSSASCPGRPRALQDPRGSEADVIAANLGPLAGASCKQAPLRTTQLEAQLQYPEQAPLLEAFEALRRPRSASVPVAEAEAIRSAPKLDGWGKGWNSIDPPSLSMKACEQATTSALEKAVAEAVAAAKPRPGYPGAMMGVPPPPGQRRERRERQHCGSAAGHRRATSAAFAGGGQARRQKQRLRQYPMTCGQDIGWPLGEENGPVLNRQGGGMWHHPLSNSDTSLFADSYTRCWGRPLYASAAGA